MTLDDYFGGLDTLLLLLEGGKGRGGKRGAGHQVYIGTMYCYLGWYTRHDALPGWKCVAYREGGAVLRTPYCRGALLGLEPVGVTDRGHLGGG